MSIHIWWSSSSTASYFQDLSYKIIFDAQNQHFLRSELHDSWPDPRIGSGQKICRKGRVGSSSARGQNLSCLGICVLFGISVCRMIQLYTQYLPCSFQCIGYKATWRMVNLYQGQRHAGITMLIVRCICCRNVAIIIVLSLRPVYSDTTQLDVELSWVVSL